MGAHAAWLRWGTNITYLYNHDGGGPDLLRLVLGTTDITPEEVQAMIESGNEDSLDAVTAEVEMRLLILGSDAAHLVAQLNDIEAVLVEAGMNRYSRGRLGADVYLEIQREGTGNVYRTRILEVSYKLDADLLGIGWQARKFTMDISFTRQYFFESFAVYSFTPQDLYNPCVWRQGTTISFDAGPPFAINDMAGELGRFQVSDVIVVQGSTSNDGTYHVESVLAGRLTVTEPVVGEAAGDTVTIIGPVRNYWILTAANAKGVYPTLLGIELHRDFAGAEQTKTIVIGSNAFSDPAYLPFLYEAEGFNYAAGAVPPVEDPDCCGGYYQPVTISGDTEQLLLRKDISTSDLSHFKGHTFYISVRFAPGAVATGYLRAAIGWPAGGDPDVVLQSTRSKLLAADQQVQFVGTLDIPPWLRRDNAYQSVSLCLYGRKAGGLTLNVDCVEVVPTDGLLKLEPATSGLDDGEECFFNPDSGSAYLSQTGGYKSEIYVKSGTGPWMYPGRDNYYYFVALAETLSELGRVHNLTVTARYRYPTLGE